VAGVYFVRILPEKAYRTFTIAVTILSTLMLLV
jgi:hypothetical protein